MKQQRLFDNPKVFSMLHREMHLIMMVNGVRDSINSNSLVLSLNFSR